MYALQEPVVGLVSGLIAGACCYRKLKDNPKITLDVIVNEILVLGFAILTYVILIVWLDPAKEFQGHDPEFEKFYQVYK